MLYGDHADDQITPALYPPPDGLEDILLRDEIELEKRLAAGDRPARA